MGTSIPKELLIILVSIVNLHFHGTCQASLRHVRSFPKSLGPNLLKLMSLVTRTQLRDSQKAVTVCAVIFLACLSALLVIQRPDKEEKAIRRRIEEGKLVQPESYVPVWLFKGLRANVLITGLVLLASPWLGRRRRPNMSFVPAPPIAGLRKWEMAACVALMGFAAWQNAPRLHHSMWGDEEFNASRFILDDVERQADDTLKIESRSWTTTLWNMRKPTNHLGYSFFARLTHEAFFEKKTGPHDPWFSESLLRTPVFISGLLLIPALFWALRIWGIRPWWALLLLVIHPWFVRFGVDGRGYGFVMLGSTLLLGILGRAMQTGAWRWWLASGLMGFFVVWSNMQSVYIVGALNLAAVVALMQRGLQPDARRLLAGRWILSNMLTLVLMVGYLAPCLPQIQEFMKKGEIHGTLDARWWKDSFSAWFFGQPWEPWDEPANPNRYAMLLSMKDLPWLHVAGIALMAGLFVAGAALLLKNRLQRPVVVFILGAPALMIVHMAITANRPYDWYFCPYVPGLCALIAVASAPLTNLRSRAVGVAALILTVSLFGYVTRVPRSLLRAYPLEPGRESVALYRTEVVNPRHPDIDKKLISGALSMYTEGYDPALCRFKDTAGLNELTALAERSGKELYVNVGFLRFVRTGVMKDVCQVLEDPARFDHVATLYGLLPYTTRDVFRYRKKNP